MNVAYLTFQEHLRLCSYANITHMDKLASSHVQLKLPLSLESTRIERSRLFSLVITNQLCPQKADAEASRLRPKPAMVQLHSKLEQCSRAADEVRRHRIIRL